MASARRRFVLYVLAIIAVVWSIAPIFNLFSASLMDPGQLAAHDIFPPAPSIGNFLRLFGFLPFQESAAFNQGLKNSLIVATLVMAITLAAALPAGYALGRIHLRGRTAVIALLLGTRTLPSVSILLPYYLYFKDLHLLGTIPGLVIIQMSVTVPVVAWVLIGFFAALPKDIEMQARLDGCTKFQAFRYTLLPLASPGIAASAVIAFLFSWNDYLYSLVLTSGTPAQTLNAFLSDLGSTTLAAGVVVQILVAIVVAGFLQKYITSLKIVDPGTVTL